MAGFHLHPLVAGFALNEKVSATPRSHMAQGGRRKLTSTEADHIGPGFVRHYGQLAAIQVFHRDLIEWVSALYKLGGLNRDVFPVAIGAREHRGLDGMPPPGASSNRP